VIALAGLYDPSYPCALDAPVQRIAKDKSTKAKQDHGSEKEANLIVGLDALKQRIKHGPSSLLRLRGTLLYSSRL
jgi:hypothetical protein